MFPRGLTAALGHALEDTPVIFLAGARQTGKSTLAQALQPGGVYRTLDDLGFLRAAQEDPQGFVASLGACTVLDEIQRAPELLLPIKASVDRDRRPGRFVLTGSANVLVLPKAADSLAGRMQVLELWPLAQAELEGVEPGFVDACFQRKPQQLKLGPLPKEELLRRALAGGYPEVIARKDPAAQARWFESYLTTLIQRDVRDLAAIEGLTSLPRLLQLLASRAGGQLNVADLARTLGMNHMTVKRYLTLFQILFLVVELPPWFENLGKRLTKTPKLYLNDSGLLSHLLGLDASGLSQHPTAQGPVLENFAVMELMKTAPWSKVGPRLHHFRTAAGLEVDLILESRKRELVGIEVKASTSISASDFKGLAALRALVGERFKCGVVLYAGREAIPFGRHLWAMPFQSLWATLP